jgi:hypothetical protein
VDVRAVKRLCSAASADFHLDDDWADAAVMRVISRAARNGSRRLIMPLEIVVARTHNLSLRRHAA